jgi:FkbM family methyltransferase
MKGGPGDSDENQDGNWKQTAGALRERLGHVRERADRLHRSVLEKDVLRDILPLRAQTLAARSAVPEARERERRFHDASSAYREAIEDETSFADCVRRIALDGLAWSVPLVRPDDPVQAERAVQHQDFPYRVIAQTRELAIGGTMLDIGANVGRMCIPRVILGDVTSAYCAEPDPLNYACLTRNVTDNNLRGLVLPDRVAVGAVTGTQRLERAKSAGGHRVLAGSTVTKRSTISVSVVTVDDWVARLGIDADHVTFVKIDVQGAEPQVLRGATRVLACRHIAWQIEIDPYLLQMAGSGTAELIALVTDHFTHFIDLNRNAPGERVRPVAELADALSYIDGHRETRTDILACTLAGRSGS